jgi:hypothetical protein
VTIGASLRGLALLLSVGVLIAFATLGVLVAAAPGWLDWLFAEQTVDIVCWVLAALAIAGTAGAIVSVALLAARVRDGFEDRAI